VGKGAYWNAQIGIMNPLGNIVFESLINPVKRRISREAKDVHGTDFPMLKDAPTFQEILPKISDILHGRLVIVYNAEFEKQMLIQTAAKYPKELWEAYDFQCTMHCAMEEYSQYIGEWSDYFNNYK